MNDNVFYSEYKQGEVIWSWSMQCYYVQIVIFSNLNESHSVWVRIDEMKNNTNKIYSLIFCTHYFIFKYK